MVVSGKGGAMLQVAGGVRATGREAPGRNVEAARP